MSNEDEILITNPSVCNLSYAEMVLRDQFVETYLTDYDAFAACVRIGYGPAYAKDYCVRFMQESYTLQRISQRERERNPASATDEELAITQAEMKQQIMTGLVREANYRGPGASQAARVAALAKLASLYGMDQPVKTQVEVSTHADGTIVIPGMMTPEQWEKAAAEQQDKLVNGTITPPKVPTNGN
jgi:hypothetical protein